MEIYRVIIRHEYVNHNSVNGVSKSDYEYLIAAMSIEAAVSHAETDWGHTSPHQTISFSIEAARADADFVKKYTPHIIKIS